MASQSSPPLNARFAPETFAGVWTALVTPLKKDLEIDWQAFERLLEHQKQGGVTGVVISGTTGESPTLSVPEKLSLIRKARAFLGSEIRIMAGTGDSNTRQSIELSRLAQDAGADSLLIVTPPYSKPSTDGLLGHFRMIAEAVSIPLCLYHVPGRTAHFLTPDQIAAICAIKGVVCVKEASGDLNHFSRVVLKTEATFLSGDDLTYLPSLAIGSRGVISVLTNVLPAEFVAMTKAYQTGQVHQAQNIHKALVPLIDALFCETNPGPVKAALHILGLCENTLRPPLAPVTSKSLKVIEETLSATRQTLAKMGHHVNS